MVARGEAREDRLGVGQETVPVVCRADLTIREPHVLAFPVTVADGIRLKPWSEHISRITRALAQAYHDDHVPGGVDGSLTDSLQTITFTESAGLGRAGA